jgi:hypothetical protein
MGSGIGAAAGGKCLGMNGLGSTEKFDCGVTAKILTSHGPECTDPILPGWRWVWRWGQRALEYWLRARTFTESHSPIGVSAPWSRWRDAD